MSKVISCSDLLLAEELAHVKNEVELLSIDNDDIVCCILEKLGFDTMYPIAYVPSKHRNMQGQVVIGYQLVGDVTLNRLVLNSPVCDATDRLIAANYQDPSMARELAGMMNIQCNYSSEDSEEVVFDEDAEVEEDYEWVAQQIRQLETVRDAIRGSMFNEQGEIKTFSEYKE